MGSTEVVQVEEPFAGSWSKVGNLFCADIIRTSSFPILEIFNAIVKFFNGQSVLKDGGVFVFACAFGQFHVFLFGF